MLNRRHPSKMARRGTPSLPRRSSETASFTGQKESLIAVIGFAP
jgi:hypothetical protein